MENQIGEGDQNSQKIGQSPVIQPALVSEKPTTKYYVLIAGIILASFVIFGVGGYYLGSKEVFRKAQPTAVLPTPAAPTDQPRVTSNEKNGNADIKTYKNSQYNFSFDYPQNYVISANSNCSSLTNNQTGCLVSLTLSSANSDYVPKAYFWLLKGIKTVEIPGQISSINFNSQKNAWVLNNPIPPPVVLSVWNRTTSGQEIIKTSNGGSQASSYYYIVPNYQRDQAAIFAVPQSYRLRCDNFINDKQKESDCSNFYTSVINLYNKGQQTADTWLPENYLSYLYSEAENIVKSYTEITR